MTIEVKVVEQGFAGVTSWWDRVMEASQRPSPFASLVWLSTWWEFFGDGAEPLILSFHRKEELVGGAAFYLQRRGGGLLPFTELRLIGDRYVGSEALDAFVRAGLESEAAPALVRFMESGGYSWDAVDFQGLRPGAVLLREEALPAGSRARVKESIPCPYLPLRAGVAVTPRRDDCPARVVRESGRILERCGFRFSRCTTEEEVGRALDHLFETLGQREKARRAGLIESRRQSFYSRVSPRLLWEGKLELYAIWDAERPRTVLLGASAGRTFFCLPSGFDDDPASYDLENLLLYQVLLEAQARGFERFDFMKGRESYKDRWTAQEETLCARRGGSWKGSLARAGGALKALRTAGRPAAAPSGVAAVSKG